MMPWTRLGFTRSVEPWERILTGLLATKEVNGNLKDDLLASLFRSQLAAVGLTIVLACVATAVIALATQRRDWSARQP